MPPSNSLAMASPNEHVYSWVAFKSFPPASDAARIFTHMLHIHLNWPALLAATYTSHSENTLNWHTSIRCRPVTVDTLLIEAWVSIAYPGVENGF